MGRLLRECAAAPATVRESSAGVLGATRLGKLPGPLVFQKGQLSGPIGVKHRARYPGHLPGPAVNYLFYTILGSNR